MLSSEWRSVILWCAGVSLLAGPVAGARSAALLAGGTYSLQSTVLLQEAAEGGGDVGYRLSGALVLEPVAADPDTQRLLLKFRLIGVQLQMRGAHAQAEYLPRASLWAAHADTQFYALHQVDHQVGRLHAYLDAADPPDVLDYKRALLSLFQFQLQDGEYKETDVSGECDVLYETGSPTVFRKTKRRCAFEAGAEWGPGGGGLRARRVSRYTLGPAGALAALHAEELVEVVQGEGQGEEAVGVKARSWHALALRSEEGGAPAPARGGRALEAALAALPAALGPTPLPLPLDRSEDDEDDEDEERQNSEEAVVAHGAALEGEEPGAGGSLAQAAALAPLLRALRAAPERDLRALLQRPDLQDRLPGLCRAFGLAGSAAAWRAARALTAPGARDAQPALALAYLAGLALSEAPDEAVAEAALALGEDAKLEAVRGAALLAGAAAARRGVDAGRAARDRLARGLARCREEAACRAPRLRALGNLRRADVAEPLLTAAERGAAPEAEEALGALRALPAGALGGAGAERAARLAGNASRPLGARALALELAVAGAERGAELPAVLVRLARALARERSADAHELRRALWQRLEARVPAPADLRTWDARAHAGTTQVLERALWAGAGWSAALGASLLTSRGVLRRGDLVLMGGPSSGTVPSSPLLAVEVWTRGLQAMAGEGEGQGQGEGEGEEEEEMAAGLRIAVGGAAQPGAVLFEGRAELLGHLWAGTGSAPTAVLRALVPLAARGGRAPLQAGAVLRARWRGAAALALDARAHASLWHRTASARLRLRAALHAAVLGEVRTRWARLRAHVRAGGEARLRIAPDLHFHSGVALCVRVHLDPHDLSRSARLESRGGARGWRVSRARGAVLRRAGRTLALGRDNDAACRDLRAHEEDDDDV